MPFAWEHLVWRRSSRFRIALPIHGPSLATLVKLIAKRSAFIADFDVERLAATLAFEPGVMAHEPAVIAIVMRTKSERHEERVLRTLVSFGYICHRD